ncbi:MAG TPA: tetratricopeptide repeat protein, partial [Pyrinomonadaceae bacterium]|nr:tetratricopeptide repeat protein [Pyrinomonadaceae bacterium]
MNRFQSSSWSDKLARWFLRQNRQEDFEKFSTELVGKLDDSEIQQYLTEFIDSKVSAKDFERQLYLKLYLSAQKRFPHNPQFVQGLLRFYKANKQQDEWRRLAAQFVFESREVRKLYLDDLAEKGELSGIEAQAHSDNSVYKLFYADAAIRLSNYESAVATYHELNSLYPNSPEFSEELINLTRSFGQRDRKSLSEAAETARSQTEFSPASSDKRTRSGELYAELGKYDRSREEWSKLIETASGDRSVYLDTATVYWDYFQYDDALRVIATMRKKFNDDTLCSFESGAIHESQHDKPTAIAEYIKALDANQDEEQLEKAKSRLATLSTRRGMMPLIETAFAAERGRRKDPAYLTLSYAQFLSEIKQQGEAEKLLDQTIAESSDSEFLDAVRTFFEGESSDTGEQAVLKRLADVSENPRRTIKYHLQLAESLSDSKKPDDAKKVLGELVAKFPNNYGVITNASDIYRRLGSDNESVAVLRSALARSRGEYRTQIAGKLSQNLIRLDRLDDAEQILTSLHSENKSDLDLFRDLEQVFVRKNEPEQLRTAFNETVAALKKSNADRREIDSEIAEFRTQMIDAFTRLKDYRSAVEQHIEIINRDPDDEQLTDNAIAYAKRFGGGDTLLKYYQATSNEAFKNYRWNVVLARIYDANGDAANAIRNYRAAIANQPEMDDLYLAASDIETRQRNFDGALRDIDKALELTNDAPEILRKKIDLLKKAGRNAEAQIVKAKLPSDQKPKIKADLFVEAAKLQGTENTDEAPRLYRDAFTALNKDPLSGDLTAAGIDGYVRSMRREEPLLKINKDLWELREKLIALADESESTKAGDARGQLSTLEGAMAQSLGDIVRAYTTDDELAAVHDDLFKRIGEIHLNADSHR